MKTLNKTTLKNRKQLPAFGKLSRKFDMEKISQSFLQFSNYELYTDLEATEESCSFKDLCVSRENLHKKFLSQDELLLSEKTGQVSSQQYRQLALTELDEGIPAFSGTDCNGSVLSFRQVNKVGSRHYVPSFDERNYVKRKKICTGYWAEILDSFRSPVTRTRFAFLAKNSRIGAHVDYDTTYSIRVHIPIVTNSKCFMFVQDTNKKVHKLHFPADGGVYFLNTGLKHWAENLGESERVHLIISINGQEDLRGMVESFD